MSFRSSLVCSAALIGATAYPAEEFPTWLSETGLFQRVETLTPAPGLAPYGVQMELWSDGADKRRWILLPEGTRIVPHDDRAWEFPVGTTFVKHFELRSGSQVRRLETRVLLRDASGFRARTYRWESSQLDARRVDDDAFEEVSVGNQPPLRWYFPGPESCVSCHSPGIGSVLGVSSAQLNDGTSASQLRAWAHRGWLDPSFDPTAAHPSYPRFDDETAGVARRARAYLATNCAHCHQPDGVAPLDMDMRHHRPLAETNLLEQPPYGFDFGVFDAKRIAAGAKDRSVLWLRLDAGPGLRMPPLGTSLPDPKAIEVLGRWIDSLR